MANTCRDLQVWQSSIDLAEKVYRPTSGFPPTEVYGLASQMRRASVSVASNIAEGWGRRSRAEYRRFIQMALGSNDELQTQLVIAERLGFGNKKMLADSVALSDRIGRMLVALHRVLLRPKSHT